jgi:hypothetical protein
MKPEIEVRELEMEDPTFQCGSSHTATAQVKNPTTKDFTYDLQLYLDVTKKVQVNESLFVPAGQTKTVDFVVVMPADEGTWEVYLDVYVGEIIAHYHATEAVITEVSPDVTVIDITWE